MTLLLANEEAKFIFAAAKSLHKILVKESHTL